jgi:glutaredoxin 3
MDRTVLIYGKSACPYTQAARRGFSRKNVLVEYKDVLADAACMEEMLKHSNGKRLVPVIVEENKVTIGFGGT